MLVVPLRWRCGRAPSVIVRQRPRRFLFAGRRALAGRRRSRRRSSITRRFNHTYLDGYVSYKFGRDDPGFSLGVERPLFGGPWLFVGGEVHDVTTSDDLWRITAFEQTLVSLTFKNSFRDYYRRQGGQMFARPARREPQRVQR